MSDSSTQSQPIRLAVIDTDSGFLQVLGKRLERMGWEHRVLGRAVPVDAIVAMRVNAVVIDIAILGPGAWDELDKLCRALPGLGVVVCTGQSTVAQRVRGDRAAQDPVLPPHALQALAEHLQEAGVGVDHGEPDGLALCGGVAHLIAKDTG